MDPNANLDEQLQLALQLLYGDDGSDVDADRLAELVITLHDWIRTGGFLPAVWRVTPTKPTGGDV